MDQPPDKHRVLARKRDLATGMLLVAAGGFIGLQFLPPFFFVRLAGAACEAAVVGGLADWFAVTALFRHPLGIPIPHTALIPSQKNEIGKALGNFVRDKFLDPELIAARVRRRNRALQLAHWLQREPVGRFLALRIVEIIPPLLKSSGDEHIRHFIGRVAEVAFHRIDFIRLVDAAIQSVIESGKHMHLVDGMAQMLEPSLAAMTPNIVMRVGEQTGRFFPKYFDRKIGAGIVRGINSWLEEIRTPGSPERQRLDVSIRTKVAEFRASPDYRRLIEATRVAVLSNAALQEAIGAAWDEIKRELTHDLEAETPQTALAVAGAVKTAGLLVEQTPALQDYVNGAAERLVLAYIVPWRAQISRFIAEVVESWDARTVADLIEFEVGAELQYVRMNGTIVGGIIGVLLFLLSAVFAAIS